MRTLCRRRPLGRSCARRWKKPSFCVAVTSPVLGRSATHLVRPVANAGSGRRTAMSRTSPLGFAARGGTQIGVFCSLLRSSSLSSPEVESAAKAPRIRHGFRLARCTHLLLWLEVLSLLLSVRQESSKKPLAELVEAHGYDGSHCLLSGTSPGGNLLKCVSSKKNSWAGFPLIRGSFNPLQSFRDSPGACLSNRGKSSRLVSGSPNCSALQSKSTRDRTATGGRYAGGKIDAGPGSSGRIPERARTLGPTSVGKAWIAKR